MTLETARTMTYICSPTY